MQVNCRKGQSGGSGGGSDQCNHCSDHCSNHCKGKSDHCSYNSDHCSKLLPLRQSVKLSGAALAAYRLAPHTWGVDFDLWRSSSSSSSSFDSRFCVFFFALYVAVALLRLRRGRGSRPEKQGIPRQAHAHRAMKLGLSQRYARACAFTRRSRKKRRPPR